MNKVDLLFIVDVTGSMSGFIQDAKCRMQKILSSLTTEFEIDLKVGLSLYRDHPSQDKSFVTAVFDLMDIDKMNETISEITVNGGGDAPEAVIDGIVDGVSGMNWRDNSRRIAFLIGDAPAHGMTENESCCQCGLTWGNAVSVTQKNKVVIYAVLLSSDSIARLNFRTIANFTGGMLIENDNAMNVILDTLKTEFDNVNLDAKVLEMLSKNSNVDDICKMLNIDRDEFTSSTSRIVQFI
jgi:hypothetical protein